MMITYIDTGAFIARFIVADQFHAKSLVLWEKLRLDRETLVTSNHVLDETLTLLARRVSYAFAAEKARLIYNSGLFTIARTTQDDELSALAFFEKYADQGVSFTDCLSFVLMKKMNIQRVFGFDRHFSQAGFVILG